MAAWDEAIRLIHLLAITIWMGGSVFAVVMVVPTVRAAGPAGQGFMMAVIRRGGFGKLFGPVASLAILTGLVLYWARGYHDAPFGDAASATLTVGAILGFFAFAEGLAVNLPAERRLKALAAQVGPQGPTPQQAADIGIHAAKIGKAGLRGLALLVLAFLLMVGRLFML